MEHLTRNDIIACSHGVITCVAYGVNWQMGDVNSCHYLRVVEFITLFVVCVVFVAGGHCELEVDIYPHWLKSGQWLLLLGCCTARDASSRWEQRIYLGTDFFIIETVIEEQYVMVSMLVLVVVERGQILDCGLEYLEVKIEDKPSHHCSSPSAHPQS